MLATNSEDGMITFDIGPNQAVDCERVRRSK